VIHSNTVPNFRTKYTNPDIKDSNGSRICLMLTVWICCCCCWRRRGAYVTCADTESDAN